MKPAGGGGIFCTWDNFANVALNGKAKVRSSPDRRGAVDRGGIINCVDHLAPEARRTPESDERPPFGPLLLPCKGRPGRKVYCLDVQCACRGRGAEKVKFE